MIIGLRQLSSIAQDLSDEKKKKRGQFVMHKSTLPSKSQLSSNKE